MAPYWNTRIHTRLDNEDTSVDVIPGGAQCWNLSLVDHVIIPLPVIGSSNTDRNQYFTTYLPGIYQRPGQWTLDRFSLREGACSNVSICMEAQKKGVL